MLNRIVLYNHEQLYIHICICMQNHNDDTIKTSEHGSLEKYTFHLIERVVCERELETEQRLQHIDLPILLAITAFFSRSPGLLNRGPGAQPLLGHASHSSIFPPTDLNFLSTGLYHNLTPTYFLRELQFRSQFNPLTVKFAPDLRISSLDASVIYTGAFLLLTAWPGQRSICNNCLKSKSFYI